MSFLPFTNISDSFMLNWAKQTTKQTNIQQQPHKTIHIFDKQHGIMVKVSFSGVMIPGSILSTAEKCVFIAASSIHI